MYKSIFTGVLVLLVNGAFAQSGTGDYNLSEETALYRKVAPVKIITREGERQLPDLYRESPLILAMIYTRCTGVCSPLLLKLAENTRDVSEKENYRIAVVSFDPVDSLQDMLRLEKYFGDEKNNRWTFAVTPQIDSLIQSIAFTAAWDSITRQFDHEALLVGINQEGYVVKKLTGLRDKKEVVSLIREINGAFVPSYPLPGSETFFSCFTYNPATQKRQPAWGLLILVAPAVLTFFVIGAVALKYRRKRQVG